MGCTIKANIFCRAALRVGTLEHNLRLPRRRQVEHFVQVGRSRPRGVLD